MVYLQPECQKKKKKKKQLIMFPPHFFISVKHMDACYLDICHFEPHEVLSLSRQRDALSPPRTLTASLIDPSAEVTSQTLHSQPRVAAGRGAGPSPLPLRGTLTAAEGNWPPPSLPPSGSWEESQFMPPLQGVACHVLDTTPWWGSSLISPGQHLVPLECVS